MPKFKKFFLGIPTQFYQTYWHFNFFHIKLCAHHVMLLTAYSSLFHLCFQHQGQDWRCHQHLKKKVPDIEGQCPKSTYLHHTFCRYFKELLPLTLCKISVFQACKSTFVSTAGPVQPRDTKTRRAHPSKPPLGVF